MLILVGKTCSGKTTAVEGLCKNLGYEKIVTYTTRPKRPGEIDGKDYHFVSVDEFKKMENRGEFAETSSYDTVFGKCYYGSAKVDYAENDSRDKVIILNPYGLKAVRASGINAVALLLDLSDDMIMNRLSNRGDSAEESTRRLAADNADFSDIDKYIDGVINAGAYMKETLPYVIDKKFEQLCA